MPQGNTTRQNCANLFIATPYAFSHISLYESNPLAAIIFCSSMHPKYENIPANNTYAMNITMPISVMRRGKLNMPVPKADAIIPNIAA